jgi:methylmalonyl-CoA/ethylmalonyl-CoA epimerase
MEIDHIGYAVKKLNLARKSFETLGFEFEEIIEDSKRNLQIQFGKYKLGGYCIELVSPLNKNDDSPVDSYLGKLGPTPYHICYRTKNLECAVGELEKNGFKVTLPPSEAIAFGNRKVVFMMNLGIGLREVVEEV